jgi:cell division protein FtsB
MARARKSGKSSSGASQVALRVKQALVVAAVVAAVLFAVQGGEYGTRDLVRQSRRRAALLGTIDSLQRTVDSLKTYRRRLDTDPALQERIARDEFGMVRGQNELLYRLAEPESGGDSASRAH